MKVLVSLDIPEIGISLLCNSGMKVTTWSDPNPMTQEELINGCRDHDALLSSSIYRIDKQFLASCRHLKIISQFAAGFDNVDVEEATSLGIPIGYTPGAMSDATADIAFSLLLSTSRKLCYMHKTIIDDEWGPFRPKAHLGIELKHKTLGIFGLGRIGLEMAKRCFGAYGMKIIYCNRHQNPKAEAEVKARFVDFDTLLKESDIISVHSVLSDETRGIFDRQAFQKMKPTAIFVNTSRGPVHNEDDLINTLKNGDIWGAGLDVCDPEPMQPDNPLLFMENVAVTPHIGSATVEARNEMSRMAAENIVQFAFGNPIPHLVNPGWNHR